MIRRLALVASVLAGGCGGSASSDGVVGLNVNGISPLADPTRGECTIYRQDGGEAVTFEGTYAHDLCSTAVHQWSSSEAFWGWSPRGNPDREACLLSALLDTPTAILFGRQLATVYDDDASICGALTASGWSDYPVGTGP